MAKFKKGDRVRRIAGDTNGGMSVGDVGTVTDCTSHEIRFEEYTADFPNFGAYSPDYFELLTPQYTPITPKVGEKYRVLKRSRNVSDNINLYTGQIIEVTHSKGQSATGDCYRIERSSNNYIHEDFFTTEYLELVSEPAQEFYQTKLIKEIAEYTTEHYTRDTFKNGKIGTFAGFAVEVEQEPINQSIIKKTMNFIKKSLLSKDDKNLIKAGYMDDNMNLTSRGREALEFITFTENKAKLVEMAEAQIAEDKEDKE